MNPDLREICTLLRNFRELCQSPISATNLADFTKALDELQKAADALDRTPKTREHSRQAGPSSIAA